MNNSVPTSPEEWRQYWQAKGCPWRTEPEIEATCQKELAARQAIVPDIYNGIYPFKGMKLSRADIEWLLATYGDSFEEIVEESGPGGFPQKSVKKGLDIRGADLNGVVLWGLPLSGLRAGLTIGEWFLFSEMTRRDAAAQMNKVSFDRAQLEGARFRGAQLQGASFQLARLQDADFSEAQLKNALFETTRLQGADFSEAQLEGAQFIHHAQLQGAKFLLARLQDADFSGARLEGAVFVGAQLQGAKFDRARLEGADFSGAQLEGAYFYKAQLQGASLNWARLEGADFSEATLVNLQGVGPHLADVQWDGCNLAIVDWSRIKILGDEDEAQQGNTKDKRQRLVEYRVAVRANRQLAVALESQGLNEDATHFAYRAQVLQRTILWLQMTEQGIKFGQRIQTLGAWLFSWFIFLIVGYGFKPGRWLLVYLGTIIVFTVLHFIVGTPHPTWLGALTMSILDLHGRPFLSAPSGLEGLVAIVESFVGLIVEAVLIAIITQRVLGK